MLFSFSFLLLTAPSPVNMSTSVATQNPYAAARDAIAAASQINAPASYKGRIFAQIALCGL